MDDYSWPVEETGAVVPATQHILRYDSRHEAIVLTVQGSDDEADVWQQNDKESNFGSLVADSMYGNGLIRALRYCCNDSNNGNTSDESTSIIRMADATKVCLLSGLRACGNRIRHVTLLSSLSTPPMSSTSSAGGDITEYSPYSRDEGSYFYDERAYGREQKRHRDHLQVNPFLVSSTDAPETECILEAVPQDVNNIMSATLLLSTTMWHCRNCLKELVLELSTTTSGGVCIATSDDDIETWKQVAFSLQKHPILEIVRIHIRPSTSSSYLNHDRERHERREKTIDEEEDEELMALAPSAPGPLDVLVTKGLVTLPRLRIFEQRGHGNAAVAGGDSAKLQARSLVALMKVPSLNVLQYSNLGLATNFDSKMTAEGKHEWCNSQSSLRTLDLSDNSLTDRDIMEISRLFQKKEWPYLRTINLLNNPDINYAGNVAIDTAVQELNKKQSAVKKISLLRSSFPLYPGDDDGDDEARAEYDDDHDDGHPDRPSTSPTTAMLPPTLSAFTPLLCSGAGGGRQEHETPPFPSFAWNETPRLDSAFTSCFSHKSGNNNKTNSNTAMMTD